MYRAGQGLIVVRPVVLGDDHGRPGAEAGEEADDQIRDHRGAAAHRRKSRRAQAAPDHDGVYGII